MRKAYQMEAELHFYDPELGTYDNALVEEKTAGLQKELDNRSKEVEELRAARQRQETLVESIIVERDMYKSIADNHAAAAGDEVDPKVTSGPQSTSTPAVGASPKGRVSDLERRAKKAEESLADLKKEFGRLVASTTAQVTGKVLTDDDQKRINEEALAKVEG